MSDAEYHERRRRPGVVTVDDQPDQTHLIAKILSRRCTVYQAATSEQAIELVAKHPVEYVLSDHNLANYDGIQLCRFLRATYGDDAHAIIFVTASGDNPDVCERIRAAGANAIVTKPFRQKHLFEALRCTRPGIAPSLSVIPSRTVRMLLSLHHPKPHN